MINNTDPKKKLWNFLSQKGLYSKDYNAFQEQFSTPESQGKLHRFMTEKQVYSKSAEDFSSQFFPPTEKPLSTEEQRQSIIDKYDQQAEEQIGSDPVISQKRDSLQSVYQQRFNQVEEGIAKEVDSYLQDKQDSLQQLLNAEQITEEQANKQLDEARLQKSAEYKQALEEQAKSFDSEYAKELNSLPEVNERIQKIEAERYKNLQETLGAFDQIEHEKELKIQEEAKKIGRKVATETQGYGYVLANDLVNAALTKAKYGVPQSIKQIDLLSTSNKMEEERKFLASLEGKADDEVVTRTLSAPKGFSPGRLEQGTVAELRAKSEAKLAKETQKIGELIKPIKELEAKIAGEGIKTDLLAVKSWDDFFQTASNIAGEQAVIMPLALLGGSYAMETAEAYYSQVSSLAKAKGITIQEVIEQGLDNPDAAATAGVISGSLDVLGTGKVVNAMRKAVTGTVKKRLAEFGGTTATEFLTEFAQSLTLQTQNNLVSGEKINLRDAVSEGLAGALMGGLLGSSVFLSNPEKTQIVKNVEKELEATTGDLGVQNGLDNSTDSTITEDNLNHEKGQEPTTARAEEEVDTDGQRDTAEQEPVNGDQPQTTDAIEENGADGQTEQPTVTESETVGEPTNPIEQGQLANESELEVFEDIVKESESFEEAFVKAKEVKDVPQEVADLFSEKYNPEGNKSQEQAFRDFYGEVKQSDALTENVISQQSSSGESIESTVEGQVEAVKTATSKPAQSLAQTENSAVNLPTKGAAITAKPSVKVQPEQLKAASEKISAASQKIQEILKKQRGQLSANPFADPELLKAVGELAAGLVEMGYLKTKEFTQALSESLGFEVEEQQAKDFLKQARITTGIDEGGAIGSAIGGTIDDTANSKTGRERSGSKTIRDNTTPEARKALNKNKPFFRTVGREETLEESAKFIDDNGGLEATKDLLMSKDAKIDDEVRFGSLFLVYKHYADKLKQAIEEGSPSDAIAETLQSIRDYMAREGTKMGRTIDLFNLFKMDGAEGVVHMQNKKAQKHNSKPKNKSKADGLDKASEEVVSEYQEAINKAVDEVFKKSSVAKATKTASKRSQTKDKLTKIKAKRDKIHKDYKESDLFYSSVVPFKPEFITYVSKLAATYVEEGYVRASDIAARIAEDIKEKFNKDIDLETISGIVQDSLEALNESQRKAIDEAIKSGNFDPKPLIAKAAKDLEIDLQQVIRSHFLGQFKTRDTLTNRIVSQLDLDPETAKRVAAIVEKELASTISSMQDMALQKLLGLDENNQKKEVKPKEKKQYLDKMIELINLGVFSREEFKNAFAEKFGLLPEITNSDAIKIENLIKLIEETESGSKASTLAKLEFVRLLQKYEMAQNWADVSHEVIITNLLSGWTTDVQNIKFNMHAAFFKYGILPIFQHKKWRDSFRASIKNKSIKTFLATNPLVEAALGERAAFIALTKAGVFGKNSSKSWAGLKDTIINGGVDSKFFDEHTDPRGFHLPNIDKDPKAQHPVFKNWKIKIGNIKAPINIIRAMQFRTRTLAAMDIFSRSMAEEMLFAQYFIEEQRNSKNPSVRKAWSKAVREGVDMEQVESETKEQVDLLTKYGVKVSKYAEKVIRHEIIETKLGIPQDDIQELKEIARDVTATMGRTGFFAKLARKAIQASNYGDSMSHPLAKFGSKMLVNAFFPFKTILGQIGDITMESIPLYNYARAYGYGFTGLKRRAAMQADLGSKAWNPKTFTENTSQMGEIGSRKFDNQIGLAHIQNTMLVGLAALFLGTDEEDYFYISGGYHNLSYNERELQNKNGVPAHTIKIGAYRFNYLNTAMHIPASIIGNWNDAMKRKDWDEGSQIRRSSLVMLYSMHSIKDVSIFSGIQDFTDFTSSALEMLNADAMHPENALEEKSSAATKLVKPIVSYTSKALPWNNNGILQVKKMFDPTSYSQKDIDEMLAYHAGLHFFPDASGSIKARFDIFGNEITTYPGESLFPLRHYLDKGKDNKDFMFLKEIDALPSALTDWKLKDDEGIYVDDQDIPVSFQRKYKVLASKNFQKLVAEIRTDYESMSEKDKRSYAKEDYRAYYGKKVSRAQFEIKLAMTRAKLLAKEDLEDEVSRFIKK